MMQIGLRTDNLRTDNLRTDNLRTDNLRTDNLRTAANHTASLAFLVKEFIIKGMEQAKTSISSHKLPLKWGVVLVVSLLVIGWIFNTPPGILGKADSVGYAVCHRISARTFHIHGRPLPLCARCTGMYLGAVLGIIYQWLIGRRRSGMPQLSISIVLGMFVLAFGIDGVNSYLHLPMMQQIFPGLPRLYEPNNAMRLVTGSGMGLTMSMALLPVFNQTIWASIDNRPLLSMRSFIGLIGGALLLDLIVLTEQVFVLYPLAIISSLGVFLILTMVYTIVWVLLLRRDNRYTRLRQLGFLLTAGFGVALLQILALDIVRYWLTGTWEGFSF